MDTRGGYITIWYTRWYFHMVSVDTDDGAAHGAFGAVPGPNVTPKTRDVPPKRTIWYKMVGDILEILHIS